MIGCNLNATFSVFKTLHITLGELLGIGKFCDWSSDSKFLIAITSRSAAEIVMYSASVVLSDTKG